ncbi:hypothetical protein QD128_000150 [Salmonella enterica]|nr:hypothetical protein [Salmonella enterica]EKT2494287.1 hypothetical protein [Salmonella enterica]EKT2657878.1 hypothetical protein [Salmonella enterica]EKT2685334.1 hypothetical protein [Salmonella enterica]
MKAEFTIKNAMILREGRSERRGEIDYNQIFCMACNSLNKAIPLTHEGNIIGRIENTYIDDKERMEPAELYGDMVFTDLDEMITLINEELFYPVAVTVAITGIHSTALDSVFFTDIEDCDFEDQQPIDLSELRDLVKAIAKNKESEKGEDVNKGWTDHARKPYIYAPDMSKEAIVNWLTEVIANFRIIEIKRKGLQEVEVCHTKLEAEIKESEAFLSAAIRN